MRLIADRVRGRHERTVNQHHGIVNKVRLVLISVDKIADEITEHIRSILTIVFLRGKKLAVVFDRWTPKTLAALACLRFCELPKHVFIKPRIVGSAGIIVTRKRVITPVQLPLARDRRFVACLLELLTKRFLIRAKISEVAVVSEVDRQGRFCAGCGFDFWQRRNAPWN